MALRPDDWLTGLLGKAAWHMTPSAEPGRLIELPQGEPCFVDAKLPVSRTEVARRLEDKGLRLVDTGMNFERPVWGAATSRHSRAARPADRLAVEEIAAPALFVFAEDDQVVDPAATRAVAARWGTDRGGTGAEIRVVIPGPEDSPSHHVIAGDILSPGMTEEVARIIGDWVAALP